MVLVQMPSTQTEVFNINSTEKVISVIFVFLPYHLHSPIVVSMVKDGEHDKTQMVNKPTFNIITVIIMMIIMMTVFTTSDFPIFLYFSSTDS